MWSSPGAVAVRIALHVTVADDIGSLATAVTGPWPSLARDRRNDDIT
jgi:hypothetical protein